MKFTTISLLDLSKYNRLDPKFAIAYASVKDALPTIEAQFSKEEASAFLSQISNKHLSVLLPLIRGNRLGNLELPTEDEVTKVVKEYPHLALLLVLKNPAVEQSMQQRLEDLNNQTAMVKNGLELIANAAESLLQANIKDAA